MAARHRSRQRALQVLFSWDVRRLPIDDVIAAFYDTLASEEGESLREPDRFMETLVRGTAAHRSDIDRRIEEKSAHWRLERMPVVDRNILRLAVFEMTQKNTPPAVVIDESLELARQFSGDESVSFINGVLDAVNKELRQ